MSALFVTYPRAGGTRFDRDYYISTHLPLCMTSWAAYGLTAANGYFPVLDSSVEEAVAVLQFESDEAIDKALASAETPAVMGDLPNFTDIAPIVSRGVAP